MTRIAVRPAGRWRASFAGAVVVTAGLALLASACGTSPSATAPVATSNPAGSPSSQQLAFASCMRSRGVTNFPDPGSSGFDKTTLHQLSESDPGYQAASAGCQHLLPTPSVTRQRQVAAEALQFSHCIRAHGVHNFPDPGSDGRIPDPATLGIDQGSPQFERANQACGRYRPPYMPSNAAYNAYARTQNS